MTTSTYSKHWSRVLLPLIVIFRFILWGFTRVFVPNLIRKQRQGKPPDFFSIIIKTSFFCAFESLRAYLFRCKCNFNRKQRQSGSHIFSSNWPSQRNYYSLLHFIDLIHMCLWECLYQISRGNNDGETPEHFLKNDYNKTWYAFCCSWFLHYPIHSLSDNEHICT